MIMAHKSGDTVVAEVRAARRDRLSQSWRSEGPLRVRELVLPAHTLELWDRAPVSATPAGYKDPWWARDELGQWLIVAWPRANGRASLPVAYGVDDQVHESLRALALLPDGMVEDTQEIPGPACSRVYVHRTGDYLYRAGGIESVRAIAGEVS